MKLVLLLILSTSAFAASDLVNEFTRRRKIVQARPQREAFHFIRKQGMDPAKLREFEMLNDKGKFALRFQNDDICFGDTETASLQCFNAVGYRTFFESGDLD